MTKTPFTRQKNWVQTDEKSGTDRIILAVYTDNDLERVGQKVGEGPSLEGCVYTTYFEVRTISNVRLRYCACDQRNYYASCRKNQETGPFSSSEPRILRLRMTRGSGKLCKSLAKIWLFGPHCACSYGKKEIISLFRKALD